MLSVLNNKRLIQPNPIFNYSLQSTYKSMNERIEREKINKIGYYNKPNNIHQKIITSNYKLISFVTFISVASFISFFINKYK